MNYEYLLALMLPEGGEAPLTAYLNTMEQRYGFAYPLPPLIPVGNFKSPFPPDRLDKAKLKALPPLAFAPVKAAGPGLVLPLREEGLIDEARGSLRGIHGKPAPRLLHSSPYSWRGVMLHPAGFPQEPLRGDYPGPPDRLWHSYRLALFRLGRQENLPWWHRLRWERLWSLRKPRAEKRSGSPES